MVELLRTNDQVIISFAGALLTDAEIAHHVADQHLSVLDESMGTIQMRVLVVDDHVGDARQVLADGRAPAKWSRDLVGGERAAGVAGVMA